MDGALAFAHFEEPWEIVGDGGHTLYVADSNIIRAIDRNTGTVSTLAGRQALSGSADGVGTDATFSLPSGLAFSNGQLYVSDTENSTIRKIDVASGAVTTVAGAAGESGMTDGAAAEARFSEPEAIVLGVDGNLYIADTDNNAIRVLTLSTGMVATLAGSPDQSDSRRRSRQRRFLLQAESHAKGCVRQPVRRRRVQHGVAQGRTRYWSGDHDGDFCCGPAGDRFGRR